MKFKVSENIINETRDFYNKISEDFNRTRSFNWREISPIVCKFINNNYKVLDLGCGNGRLFDLLKQKNVSYVGVDASKNLINLATKKYKDTAAKFFTSDVLNLPFSKNSFDAIISLAVLHHIPSTQNHQKFFKEIKKVLKKDGILILTVWNLWQNPKAINLLFKYTFLKLFRKSDLDFFDIFYPWKNSKGELLGNRYLHFFSIRSLEKLAKNNGFQVIKSGVLPRGKKYSNIYMVVKNK